MAMRNVVLTPHQEQVIQDLVQSGRYQNASEVMPRRFAPIGTARNRRHRQN